MKRSIDKRLDPLKHAASEWGGLLLTVWRQAPTENPAEDVGFVGISMSEPTQTHPIRIFAALGSGDIVGSRRENMNRGRTFTTSIAFSDQLFDYCKAAGNPILAISSNSRTDNIHDGVVCAENQPKSRRSSSAKGWRFHARELSYSIYLAYRARRFRADVAFIDSGTTHYFTLTLFRLVGILVVPNLHNVLWPSGFPPTSTKDQIVRWLNRIFFRNFAAGAIGVSPECERQVSFEASGRIPFVQYRCQFNQQGFATSAEYDGGAFHVAFVGRVEVNKGALDLVEISEILARTCPVPVIFHVCGDGAALGSLRELVNRKGLERAIITHGHLNRDALLKLYSECHAVIVPTTSRFPEGMPQVCAEAAIAGLPIVASRLTNATDVIGPAVAEAQPDNPVSYAEQLCRLSSDRSFYRQLRSATATVSEQFFDRSLSYPAAVDSILGKLFVDHRSIREFRTIFTNRGT
ncbi:Glycosyltransferaselike [Bradyrhizobium sp.]|uniref:glycosyltransferase family 4 protein n=1 Tax=Bradyrhizobium sp. TaxID=376 RepID=UPI0007C17C02|nr:glycosyltransferase family 4 protein [Bradyrhizobium sp.]CUT11417.1 Glycosyltransferaselike [Bradyrhizobium sp.]